jgi:hypothetical protein
MAIVAEVKAAVAGMGADKGIVVQANLGGTDLMVLADRGQSRRFRHRRSYSISSTKTRTTR